MSSPATRAKALAHVGIAFAICFCIGPPIGAYFASRPLPPTFTASGIELNVYAAPALLTLVLLVLETVFLILALPETRGKRAYSQSNANDGKPVHSSSGKSDVQSKGDTATKKPAPVQERLSLLKTLRRFHFLFLGVFSGVEFTLTFLTFDRTSCHGHFRAYQAISNQREQCSTGTTGRTARS